AVSRDDASTGLYTLSLHDALPICAECVRLVAIALKPVVPRYAAAVEAQLGIGPLSLASLDDAVGAHTTISGVDKIYLRPEQEDRSEEHTLNSSHVKISYAVFCLKK